MANSGPATLSSLMPGANLSGSSVAVPPSPMSSLFSGSPSIGGNTNPFLPAVPSGQNAMPMTNPSSAGGFPANTGGGTNVGPGPSLANPAIGAGTKGGYDLWRSFMRMGYPSGIASLLVNFLSQGAGYNSQVAQSLISQMQPSIERGTENIMEQFSAMGNRFGSPAAVGLGDYMSQVQLNIGEILSQLYEQSVQNYMEILLGTTSGRNETKKPGIWQQLQQVFGDAASGLSAAGLG